MSLLSIVLCHWVLTHSVLLEHGISELEGMLQPNGKVRKLAEEAQG